MNNNRNLVVFGIVFSLVFIGITVIHKVKNQNITNNQEDLIENPFEELTNPMYPDSENPEDPYDLSLEKALTSITTQELKEIVEKLSSPQLEGRMSGKKGNELAADYIEAKFKSFGLKTMRQEFSISKKNYGPNNEVGKNTTENIYGWIEGSEKPDEIIVVGAHMDHIGYGPYASRSPREKNKIHPGADDNASGVAALLEIAEAISNMTKPKRTILFQAYSAEELGLIGSRWYCSNPKFPLDKPDINKHIAMINLDMIGYLGEGIFMAKFHEGTSSVDLKNMINKLDNKYDFALGISGTKSGGSDHASFYNRGIPVVMIHTGLHKYYHTPLDTYDKLNYEGMEKIACYALELTLNIDNNDISPVFEHEYFERMEYIYDHWLPEEL